MLPPRLLTTKEAKAERSEETLDTAEKTTDNLDDTSEDKLQTDEKGIKTGVDGTDQDALVVSETRAPCNRVETHDNRQVLDIVDNVLDRSDNVADDFGEDLGDFFDLFAPSLELDRLDEARETSGFVAHRSEGLVGDVDAIEDISQVDLRIIRREDLVAVRGVEQREGPLLRGQRERGDRGRPGRQGLRAMSGMDNSPHCSANSSRR